VKGEPKSPEHSKAILADRFTSGGALVDKMQTEKKEEVISSVMKSKPVSDIAAAIGINDRFYFIRELFSGDALAYNDTIKRLNAAASLGEAMRILDESTVMGSDPAAQSSFVDVVRRKFSLHV
jgi:CTP:phosphocholine cytidylyltransferase-like protein